MRLPETCGLSDGKHHFESGECPLNKPDCDPAKLAEATELRRRLYGRGRGKAKKQNANVWESADLCPCCDDEADGDLDGPTPRPRAVELAHAQAEVAPDPSLASSEARPTPSGETDAERFTLSADGKSVTITDARGIEDDRFKGILDELLAAHTAELSGDEGGDGSEATPTLQSANVFSVADGGARCDSTDNTFIVGAADGSAYDDLFDLAQMLGAEVRAKNDDVRMSAAFAGFCGGAGFVATVLFLALAVCTVNVWAGRAAEFAVAVGRSFVATYGPCAAGRGVDLTISGLRRLSSPGEVPASLSGAFRTCTSRQLPTGPLTAVVRHPLSPPSGGYIKAARAASLEWEPAAWRPSYWAADEWVRPPPSKPDRACRTAGQGALASPPSGSSRYPSSLLPPASRPPPSRWVECAVSRALAATSNAHSKKSSSRLDAQRQPYRRFLGERASMERLSRLLRGHGWSRGYDVGAMARRPRLLALPIQLAELVRTYGVGHTGTDPGLPVLGAAHRHRWPRAAGPRQARRRGAQRRMPLSGIPTAGRLHIDDV